MTLTLQPFARNPGKPRIVRLQRLINQRILAIVKTLLRKAHPPPQLAKQHNVTLRLAQRSNRPFAHLREQMPIRPLHILHLEKRRRRQQHIRIVRRIGKELLMHHGKQILPPHPAQHIVLVRSDRRRIGVIDKQRLDRRPVASLTAQRSQRLPQQTHIHHPRRPSQRTRPHQLRHLQRPVVERKRPRSRELQTAALVLPRPSQQRQHANRPRRGAAVFTPLNSIVQPDHRRALPTLAPCHRIVPRQPHNRLRRDPRSRRNLLQRILRTEHMRLQLIEPRRTPRDVFAILQPHHMHHPKRQRRIGPGIDRQMLVGQRRRARPVRINHHQLRPVPPGLLDERP